MAHGQVGHAGVTLWGLCGPDMQIGFCVIRFRWLAGLGRYTRGPFGGPWLGHAGVDLGVVNGQNWTYTRGVFGGPWGELVCFVFW